MIMTDKEMIALLAAELKTKKFYHGFSAMRNIKPDDMSYVDWELFILEFREKLYNQVAFAWAENKLSGEEAMSWISAYLNLDAEVEQRGQA